MILGIEITEVANDAEKATKTATKAHTEIKKITTANNSTTKGKRAGPSGECSTCECATHECSCDRESEVKMRSKEPNSKRKCPNRLFRRIWKWLKSWDWQCCEDCCGDDEEEEEEEEE